MNLSTRSTIAAMALLPALWACTPKPPPDPVVPTSATVKSFSASPTHVSKAGEKVTLAWKVQDASSVSIATGDGAPVALADAKLQEGSTQVEIGASTVFVLSAHGEGGSDTAASSVVLSEKPDDLLFTALPREIRAGEKVTLVWNAPFAQQATITDANGEQLHSGAPEGSLNVFPKFTTSYRIDADGKTLEVPVKVSPVISAFEATPSNPAPGGKVTLHWSVGGATSVSLLSPGRGELVSVTSPAEMLDGSFEDTVPVNIDTTRILRYELEAHTATEVIRQEIELWLGVNPRITTFVVPGYAHPGSNYVVSWQTLEASALEIAVDGIVVYQAQSQAEVTGSTLTLPFPTPTTTQEVELRLHSARGGYASEKHTVDAVGFPSLVGFSSTPAGSVAHGGDPVTLTWNVPNARNLKIREKRSGTVLTQASGVAAEMGSLVHYPNKPTVYVLEADNTIGDLLLPNPEVAVGVTAPARLAFSARDVPAGSQVTLTGTTVPGSGTIRADMLVQKNLPGDQFVDIAATGTALSFVANDDLVSKVFALPQPFLTTWAGMAVGGSSVCVSINGWMVFSTATISGPASPTFNFTLPAPDYEPKALLPLTANLIATATTRVFWQLDVVNGQKRLIVQWTDVAFATNPAARSATFQTQLYENGEVVFAYSRITGLTPTDKVWIGITNADETAAFIPMAHQLDVNKQPAAGDTFHFFAPLQLPMTVTTSNNNIVASVDMGNGQVVVEDWPTLEQNKFFISEVNYNPVVGKSEWFELTSTSAQPIDLSGWTIDFGGGLTHVISGPLLLPPKGRLVFGPDAQAAEASAGGAPVNYVYGAGLPMPDSIGSLKLSKLGQLYTQVSWASPGIAGTAMQCDIPRVGLLFVSGNPSAQTCPATASYGSSGQKGTPGQAAGFLCHPFQWSMSRMPGAFQSIQLSGMAVQGLLSPSNLSYDAVDVPLDFTVNSGRPINIAGTLYGNAANPLRVDSNGYVALSGTVSQQTNLIAPAIAAPNGMFAPFWDDLAGGTPGAKPSGVFWQQFDPDGVPTSGDEYTLISWESWKYVTTTNPNNVNFQIKFIEATGDIEFHYGTLEVPFTSVANGVSATAWIESPDGKYALPASVNQPNIQSNTAVRYTWIR